MFQFNFVGKLLGPKGNSLKRLQEETMTKMAILGRGSMRDKQKVSTTSHDSLIICYTIYTFNKFKMFKFVFTIQRNIIFLIKKF